MATASEQHTPRRPTRIDAGATTTGLAILSIPCAGRTFSVLEDGDRGAMLILELKTLEECADVRGALEEAGAADPVETAADLADALGEAEEALS